MDVYTGLMEAMNSEYELVRRLREGERVSVSVVRHARSGRRYILRLFPGCGDGCRRLLEYRRSGSIGSRQQKSFRTIL